MMATASPDNDSGDEENYPHLIPTPRVVDQGIAGGLTSATLPAGAAGAVVGVGGRNEMDGGGGGGGGGVLDSRRNSSVHSGRGINASVTTSTDNKSNGSGGTRPQTTAPSSSSASYKVMS